jgi:hypothetical protein
MTNVISIRFVPSRLLTTASALNSRPGSYALRGMAIERTKAAITNLEIFTGIS